MKWDSHDGGFPGAVGPQQGSDLVSVEGEGQVPHSGLVWLVLLSHGHQGDAWGPSSRLSLPVLQRGP